MGAHWGTRPRCASPTARGFAGCDFHASSVTRGASAGLTKSRERLARRTWRACLPGRRGPGRRLCSAGPGSRTANRLSGWWGLPAAPRSPARPLAPRLVVQAVQQPRSRCRRCRQRRLPLRRPRGSSAGPLGKWGRRRADADPCPNSRRWERQRQCAPAVLLSAFRGRSAPPVRRRQVRSCGRGGRGGEDGVGRAPRARRPEDGCPERRGQSRARAPLRAPSRAGPVSDPAAGATPGARLPRGYREVWPGTGDPAPKATSPHCPPLGQARGSDSWSRGNHPGGDLHQVVLLGMRSAPVPGRTVSGFSRPLGATAGGGTGEGRCGPGFSSPRPAQG